jgi:hypothetical protein
MKIVQTHCEAEKNEKKSLSPPVPLPHNTLVFCLFDHFASKMGLQTSISRNNIFSVEAAKVL